MFVTSVGSDFIDRTCSTQKDHYSFTLPSLTLCDSIMPAHGKFHTYHLWQLSTRAHAHTPPTPSHTGRDPHGGVTVRYTAGNLDNDIFSMYSVVLNTSALNVSKIQPQSCRQRILRVIKSYGKTYHGGKVLDLPQHSLSLTVKINQVKRSQETQCSSVSINRVFTL